MANGPWCGKWALVTGASSGIGAALAEELAAGGAHLVLTARRARRLATLRTRLRAAHGVRIKVLAADLAQPNTAAEIFAFTQERGIAVDLLVNNAGIGSYGEFRESDLERELGIIHVNCSALVRLTCRTTFDRYASEHRQHCPAPRGDDHIGGRKDFTGVMRSDIGCRPAAPYWMLHQGRKAAM